MIATHFIELGYPIHLVLKYTGLSRSSYYHKPKSICRLPGRPPSNQTSKTDGTMVSNNQVIQDIKEVQGEEFVDYGYLKMTYYLRDELQYRINPKKVYRLMGENNLMQKNLIRKRNRRTWVKDLVPQTKYFFHYLEFDIKYVWISGQRRNALILTVIDVHSRWVLGQYISWQIDKNDVIRLFKSIFDKYPKPERIFVRNDNGSQMEASIVQEYFRELGVIQEFTKPATPEQNAHIESYHSIMERTICAKYEFDDILEFQATMERWLFFYNTKRIHSGIKYKSPLKYLKLHGYDENSLFINQCSVGELSMN